MSLRIVILTTLLVVSNIALGQAKALLKVGVMLPFSGPMAPYGQEVLNGAETALEDIKQSDPDLIKQIQLINRDSQQTNISVEQTARDLFTKVKIDILFGSLTGSTTMAMAPAAIEAEKPLITPTATSADIMQKGKFIYRTCYSDLYQGAIMAKFVLNHLKKKKAALLFDKTSDHARSFAIEFERYFTRNGGLVVSKKEFTAPVTDLKETLQSIRKHAPQVLVVPGYYAEAGLIMKQAKAIALHIPIVGGDGWDDPRLYEASGKEASEGHFFVTPFFVDDPQESVVKFVTAYQNRYGRKPTALAALGYDGLIVITDAFKRAKSNLSQPFIQALELTKNVNGVSGFISINATREAQRTVTILQTTQAGNKIYTKLTLED